MLSHQRAVPDYRYRTMGSTSAPFVTGVVEKERQGNDPDCTTSVGEHTAESVFLYFARHVVPSLCRAMLDPLLREREVVEPYKHHDYKISSCHPALQLSELVTVWIRENGLEDEV